MRLNVEGSSCVICKSPISQTPHRRKRLTCSPKCRRIKSAASLETYKRRAYLSHLIKRLEMRLFNVKEEFNRLGGDV